jgi:hypothetical protein
VNKIDEIEGKFGFSEPYFSIAVQRQGEMIVTFPRKFLPMMVLIAD